MHDGRDNAPDVPASLPVFVAERLAKEIEDYRLKPGDRLSEEAIAERFGVSRAPVREALRALAQEDLVVIRPRRGAWVRTYTPEEVSEIFELRSALFGLAAELFALRRDDAAMEKAERNAREIAAAAADPKVSPERFIALTLEGSDFIIENCGNSRLIETMRRLTRRSFRHFAALANAAPGRQAESSVLADEIVQALRDRDAKRAGAWAREAVDRNHAEARRRLDAGDTPPEILGPDRAQEEE